MEALPASTGGDHGSGLLKNCGRETDRHCTSSGVGSYVWNRRAPKPADSPKK